MRRLALFLAPCLFSASAVADVPAELLGTPPPAAAAPTGDAGLVDQVLPALVTRDEATKLGKLSASNRAELVADALKGMRPHDLAALRYAGEHFAEGGALLTFRTVALIALGAPESIHDIAAHEWAAVTAPALASPLDLIAVLKPGLKPLPILPGAILSGPLPTEVWVYPGKTVNDKRLLWFTDEGADGTWQLAKEDVNVPLADIALAGESREMPAELFPAVGLGATFEPLPTLDVNALPISVSSDSFRASAGKTLVRVMALIDPADIDLELDGVDAAVFAAAAQLWLRIEKDGQPEHQVKMPASSFATGSHWFATFDVALPPGRHDATLLVVGLVGKQNQGGMTVVPLEVPSYTDGMALSSVVLAKAESIGGEMALPKAPINGDGSLAPFQIGTFTVRPQVPPVFKRGDTIAVVVQVYGEGKASMELDLLREGSYQNSTEPVAIARFPHTGIELITVVPEFVDGAYEFRLTAKFGGTVVSRKVSFRVKG
jgi:hypothetical protein